MKDNDCILFPGSASTELTVKISARVGRIGDIYHHTFASGEKFCQLKENVRGADVFLIQSTSNPANDNLMQLLVMADAARRASAGRITAVIPNFGYARQEKKEKSRVPISAKLVMDLIAAAGINRIVTMDLHAAQLVGFTNLPIDHLYFQPTLEQFLIKKNINIDVVVAPDIGAVKRANEFAERMHCDFAFIAKKRKDDIHIEVTQFVGEVKDKDVIILDDLTESAGTLIGAATECKKNGANHIHCAITHGCLTPVGIERLNKVFKENIINSFFMSNTVSENLPGFKWGDVIDISNTFAQAIKSIHNNESVSALFI